jgi:nucleoside-diphosphate-sugar epimerase
MPQVDPHTILVTGGRGFIGRHLVKHLLASGSKTVISVDRAPISSGSRKPSHRQIEIELDIRDRSSLKEVFSKFDVDCVFDLASVTDVGLTAAEYKPNIEMTEALIECVLAFNITKYIFYSTQFVFRKEGALPDGEQDYFPIEAYGESKIKSEMLIRSALDRKQQLILRPTYVWGPGHTRFRDGFLYRVARGHFMVPMTDSVRRYYGYVDTICQQTIQLSEFEFKDLPQNTFYISDASVSLKWFCEQFIFALRCGHVWRVPSTVIRLLGAIGDFANKLHLSFPINKLQADEMTKNYPIPLDPTLAITQTAMDYRLASEAVVAWALSDPEFARRIRISL